MLSWKRKRSSAESESACVGLAIGEESVAVVAFDGEVEGQPNVLAWESYPYSSSVEIQSGLQRFVDAHDLAGKPCRCVLSPNDYSLRLVERPANVPDEELVDATRWLVRDLIDFDIESAALTILTIPDDSGRARTPLMFVVAAQPEPTLELGQMIEAVGLELRGFEIVESATLALDAHMPEIVAGGAVLRLAEKASVLTVSHERRLYLARNLHTDLAEIDRAADRALSEEDPAGPGIIECLDPLLLDVQRSFDYYESEYGKAPASRLTLLPSPIDLTPLVPALSEALRPVQVETYDLTRFFFFPEAPPADVHQMLALAIGATLAPTDVIGDGLLPASMKKSEEGFGLASVARGVGVMAAGLAVYFAFSLVQLGQARSELAAIEVRRDTLSTSLATALEEASKNASALDPEAEIAGLTAQRNARLEMLRDMTRRSARSDAHFSDLLTGLARQDLQGVWLERIEFSDGGDSILLEGRTLEAESLPAYLKQLGTEAGFGDRKFRRFEVQRDDEEEAGLTFRIATQTESTNADEARR